MSVRLSACLYVLLRRMWSVRQRHLSILTLKAYASDSCRCAIQQPSTLGYINPCMLPPTVYCIMPPTLLWLTNESIKCRHKEDEKHSREMKYLPVDSNIIITAISALAGRSAADVDLLCWYSFHRCTSSWLFVSVTRLWPDIDWLIYLLLLPASC